MTCIIGLVEKGTMYMGGDSAAVNSVYDLRVRVDEKVFRKGEFLVGFTSSYRMGQLLRYKLSPPAHPEGMDAHEYMASLFVEAVRECLKAGGYQTTKDGVDTGGDFLVAYRGRLFCVDRNYQVTETLAPFGAVGCAHAYARGAMMALAATSLSPKRKVLRALEIAERCSAGVRAPFKVLTLKVQGASK